MLTASYAPMRKIHDSALISQRLAVMIFKASIISADNPDEIRNIRERILSYLYRKNCRIPP